VKLLVAVGHPAHVHYFKNLVKILKSHGHEVFIMAQDRGPVSQLLESHQLDFFLFQDSPKGLIRKFFYMLKMDCLFYRKARKFKPDLYIGFAVVYIAHIAFLFRRPSIIIDDTENNTLAHLSFKHFATTILTPSCFYKSFGKKHLKFEGYMELCYLHPEFFLPDASAVQLLGLKDSEKYVVMRFVSWQATHDIGHKGLTLDNKLRAVKEFSKYARVFISSEKELPDELMEYQIKIPPEKMHDVLAEAVLLFGESSTMASECACLGTPSIYIDDSGRGYTDEEEKRFGLVFNFTGSPSDQDRAIQKGVELIKKGKSKKEWQMCRKKLLNAKINPTRFLVWFVENYPESVKIMKDNYDFQYKFK
jgi:predicted glycosyltransferase